VGRYSGQKHSCSIGATGIGKTFLGYYFGSKRFTIMIRILQKNNFEQFSKPWELLLQIMKVFDRFAPVTFLRDIAGIAYRFMELLILTYLDITVRLIEFATNVLLPKELSDASSEERQRIICQLILYFHHSSESERLITELFKNKMSFHIRKYKPDAWVYSISDVIDTSFRLFRENSTQLFLGFRRNPMLGEEMSNSVYGRELLLFLQEREGIKRSGLHLDLFLFLFIEEISHSSVCYWYKFCLQGFLLFS
jgi:hypothetical protein